jgi:hypothetical protein
MTETAIFFRRKPLTEDELRAREEARRLNEERRFRKFLRRRADGEAHGCPTLAAAR